MPRGSASAKRQPGASASHAKHDNGLVAPGKKVSRSKTAAAVNGSSSSSSSVNGSAQHHADARTRSANAVPTATSSSASSLERPALPPQAHSIANGTATTPFPATNGYAHHYQHQHPDTTTPRGLDDMGGLDARTSSLARRGSLGDAASETSASADSFHAAHQSQYHPPYPHEPRQIDVNASKFAADVHRDPGPFDYAATVLMSLPIHDTLAILLILMHVSPLTLSVIYTVFTVLTFASPLTAHSVVNVHLAELLDWHSTMPSLVTVLCVDVLALLVFLFLWPSVQNAILDLAKPVIAATLGGGAASRGGQSRTVSACFAIMIGTHVFKNTRGYWSRFLQLLPPSWRISPDPDDPLEDVSFNPVSAVRNPQPYFTVLGLHILMQGVVRYIREWYIRRERISAASASSHAGDPEAGKPTSTDAADATAQGGPDHHHGESTPNNSHQVSTASSTKRRRKQSAQVRLQQPLWAALASTKVVMVKEYELSHATSEAASPGATDIHNLGNAPFDREGGKIWISYVGCDEVSFDTSPFPDDFSSDTDSEAGGDEHNSTSRGRRAAGAVVDRSKPFYVRINNAHWLSTRIEPARDMNGEAPEDVESSGSEGRGPQGTRWTGDIYGLRPTSKYVCQFVDSRTDAVLFATTITTTRERTRSDSINTAAGAANAGANGMPNGQRRPHSPTTTLRTSIGASDARLAAERARLKTLRKEWKVKVNALRRDNESTDHAIGSAGGTDDRYRQKIRQQETQKAQAEKEARELGSELLAFDSSSGSGGTAEEIGDRRGRAEERWAGEKAVFDAAQREFKSYSAASAGAVKGREAERQTLQTRRNKIAGRVAKVDGELANIADANRRGLNEAERRRQEREGWARAVAVAEEKMGGELGALRAEVGMLEAEHEALAKQAKALHAQMTFASAPAFEEYPPASSWAGPPNVAAPVYAPPAWDGGGGGWGFPPVQPPPGFRRGRSSSMLSDVSGFTQLSGEIRKRGSLGSSGGSRGSHPVSPI